MKKLSIKYNNDSTIFAPGQTFNSIVTIVLDENATFEIGSDGRTVFSFPENYDLHYIDYTGMNLIRIQQ